MRPIGPAEWFEVDDRRREFLDAKAALERADLDRVFRAEAGTEDAQSEVLESILEALVAHHGARLESTPEGRAIRILNCQVSLQVSDPPLLIASRLVQDDLCLMVRSESDWRLSAAALAFPSSWSLAEKMGQPLAAIHDPVPGFAGRMEAMVTRIFDNLRPGARVLRWNWSLYDDPGLHHPAPHGGPRRWRDPDGAVDLSRVFLRVERQTLFKLPRAGAILFAIKVRHESATRLDPATRRALAVEIGGLTPPQRGYKNLVGDADDLIAALIAPSAGPGPA